MHYLLSDTQLQPQSRGNHRYHQVIARVEFWENTIWNSQLVTGVAYGVIKN